MLEIAEADLPPTARNLVRLVGWRGAMALIREMPGTRIYCPGRSPDHSRAADARFGAVAELVGHRNAERLYAHYRAGIVEIPNCRAAVRAARDRTLRAMYDAGATVEQICARFGLSRRQVFYILKISDVDATAAQPRAANIGGQIGLF